MDGCMERMASFKSTLTRFDYDSETAASPNASGSLASSSQVSGEPTTANNVVDGRLPKPQPPRHRHKRSQLNKSNRLWANCNNNSNSNNHHHNNENSSKLNKFDCNNNNNNNYYHYSGKQFYSKIFRQYLPSCSPFSNLIKATKLDHPIINEDANNPPQNSNNGEGETSKATTQSDTNIIASSLSKFNNDSRSVIITETAIATITQNKINTRQQQQQRQLASQRPAKIASTGESEAVDERRQQERATTTATITDNQLRLKHPHCIEQREPQVNYTKSNIAGNRQLLAARSIISNAFTRLKITCNSNYNNCNQNNIFLNQSSSDHQNKQQLKPPKSTKKVYDLNNNNNNNDSSYNKPNLNPNSTEHSTYLISSESGSSQEDLVKRTKQQKVFCKSTKSSKQSRSSNRMSLDKTPLVCLIFGLIGLLTIIEPIVLALQQQQVPPSSSVPLPFRSQQGTINNNNNNLNQQSPNNSPNNNNLLPVSGSRAPINPQPAAGSLVANINCNKIRGHVTLTPNPQGGTTVTTQISSGPPGEVYQWSIHQFPVKPGAAMCSCSALILGTKLIDLSEMHGNLPSDQGFTVQSSLSLFGFDSPVGHSLMLRGMKTGVVACATFLPTSRKANYRAKFHAPLSGSVTIFQTAFGTSFISHLMYSNGTRRHSQHRFDLIKSDDEIVATSLLSGAQATPNATPSARADLVAKTEQREHEHELAQCKNFNQNHEPLLRNISYQLSVSTENFGMRGRTSMVLPQIPFETFSSVFVVIYSEHDPSEPIACAPLRFAKPKTAAAKFQSVSVQGNVIFSQDSPYDATLASVNLQIPNSDAHSYGIDELPMIIRRKSDTRVCPNIREIIYNPHHVEPSSVPPEGEATSDQYAVGDLSGKYGSLTGKSSEKIQVSDFNLPLFGPTSIVGRAMTIYSADGVAIACSNVELTTPMTTAFATFDFGIQGQFIFRQPLNDCNGDTYVYIEVSKPTNGGATSASLSSATHDHLRTLDHNWHIHTNPVDSGLDHLSTTDCSPAGAHFNPYNTSTSSIYTRDCTPFNVLRCELGDLSSKMFTIEIPPYRVKGGQEPDIGKFFGTDIDLPLCGPVSVVNRSVVVHVQDFGHQRLACSTVIEFKPRTS